jgi:hypothetical protein
MLVSWNVKRNGIGSELWLPVDTEEETAKGEKQHCRLLASCIPNFEIKLWFIIIVFQKKCAKNHVFSLF